MTDTIKPITPDEIGSKKKELIPDFVIQAFNTLIAKNWNTRQAKVKQDGVIEQIIFNYGEKFREMPDDIRQKIFDNKWLDVEEIYRDAGWIVNYYRPAYCETFQAYYIFKRK